MKNNKIPQRRNIWNLVLGLIFFLYGSYRIYTLSGNIDKNTFSFILAIAFVIFGLYDLWKYKRNL